MKHTYYYISGTNVETLNTIHSERYLKTLVPELKDVRLVTNKKHLNIPDGHIIKKGKIVPTKETAKRIEKERREKEAKRYVFDSLVDILLCVSGEKSKEELDRIVEKTKTILSGKE